jgi:hypothetical protein
MGAPLTVDPKSLLLYVTEVAGKKGTRSDPGFHERRCAEASPGDEKTPLRRAVRVRLLP